MSGGDVLPVPVLADGPAWDVMTEYWRRCRAAGHVSLRRLGDMTPEERSAAVMERRRHWSHWDCDDYSRDAPDVMPAGSCIHINDFPEQSTVRRDE